MALDKEASPPHGDEAQHALDPAQVDKAAVALLRHLKSIASQGQKPGAQNLFAADPSDADEPENAEAIWCQITTLQHIVEQKRLKPGRVVLPHSLNRQGFAICIITPDPQRSFKTVLESPAFPKSLSQQIRILGLTKLKQRYKTFESRRQLRAMYDVFLADDRIIAMLPRLLGKTLYESSKRPIPVRLEAPKSTDSAGKKIKPEGTSILAAGAFAQEVERALSTAHVHLSPSTCTAAHIGWSIFTPEQLSANITAFVEGMVAAHVPKGWRNMRSVHIKGPQTVALPVWMTDELWVESADVLEDEEAEELARKRERPAPGGKRKDRALEAEPTDSKRAKADKEDDGFSAEMAARREALREQKRAGRAAAEKEEESGTVTKTIVKKTADGSVHAAAKEVRRVAAAPG